MRLWADTAEGRRGTLEMGTETQRVAQADEWCFVAHMPQTSAFGEVRYGVPVRKVRWLAQANN